MLRTKGLEMFGFIGLIVAGYGLVVLAGVQAILGRKRAIASMPDYDFPVDFSPELENVPLPDGQGVDELPQ
jgi:hypothetical protein